MSTTIYVGTTPNRRIEADLVATVSAALKQAQVIGRAIGEISNAIGAIRPLTLRQTLDSIGLKDVPLPSLARARACGAPDCRCPSPELGEIRRVVDRPEQVDIAVRLRNTTRSRRSFALQAGKVVSQTGEAGGGDEPDARTGRS